MDDHGADLDSLPYIDKEYDDPAMRSQVLEMIQEEMGRMSPPAIPRSTSLFKNSELLRKEYERVKSGRPLPPFDIDRYKLEAPTEPNIDEWRWASDNAASQLEHQNIRLVNLELLQQFGANAWKLGNFQKERMLAAIEKATDGYRQTGVDLNKARKYEQVEAGVKLRDLESRWEEGVRQCIEIQVANCELLAEISKLEHGIANRTE
ncbi:hypothetical protein GGH94_005082 [Coemansia aciculifera]|uniref:Breast carcinoma amplified sequence 2 n=1 Tax=Coemansia aciculifera TaxID=417176 RepID=A0A9W8M3H1_9FUNG|nr:hypothetical protein GGH94_005082 [Coemansia aciculifera]KAJ2871230.1 hypothetical protein GGH93_004985 [Coemansia aciculifera]KAJ2878635.1 hypothetical protein H4R27_005724 [Coemansia aciculifera]